MINKSLIVLFFLGSFACSSQDSKKSSTPVKAAEEEKVLGEDEDNAASELGSQDASQAEGKKSDDAGVDGTKEKATEVPQNLDISKLEELVYKYKDGDEFKEIAVKFSDSACSIATAAGVINGSFIECAALKSAIAKLGDIPVKADASCEKALEQIIVKADGIEQALNTKTVPGCDIPTVPAGSADLLAGVLKNLPL